MAKVKVKLLIILLKIFHSSFNWFTDFRRCLHSPGLFKHCRVWAQLQEVWTYRWNGLAVFRASPHSSGHHVGGLPCCMYPGDCSLLWQPFSLRWTEQDGMDKRKIYQLLKWNCVQHPAPSVYIFNLSPIIPLTSSRSMTPREKQRFKRSAFSPSTCSSSVTSGRRR